MKQFILLLCCMTLFLLAGCSKKTALTQENFVTQLEAEGYTVSDTTGDYKAGTVNAILIAQKEDHQIEFYHTISVNEAVSMFNTQKQVIESYKGNGSVEGSVSFGNYSSYSLTSGGECYIISRIDDTVIYTDIPSDIQKEIKEIVKKIGY